ncbi:hypothetical protein EJ04DRAFT_454151 [Polyplosphaeria fusca]|uniref:Uncharacterized protein n=1 Tax=Polyplosphaeria fusca TaxID=682080 RepID=A0A9P4RCE2_9PLEO|nr:hypothetical protein EJ04DRAFT_454151 [Polyplosphaeria fusca]
MARIPFTRRLHGTAHQPLAHRGINVWVRTWLASVLHCVYMGALFPHIGSIGSKSIFEQLFVDTRSTCGLVWLACTFLSFHSTARREIGG